MPTTIGAAIGLAYDGLRIRVEAAPPHLEWLGEFLEPQFDRIDPRDCDRRVVLVEDTSRHRAALDRGPDPRDGELDCFALDSSVIRLPLWKAEADTTVFHREYDAFYSVDPGATTVTLLTGEGNGAIRTSLMRAVRELAMNHSYATGGLFLHAAALAHGERIVMIAGESAAGKTTLLLRFLREGRASYVANDRMLVRFGPASVSARGMPSVVTLRPGTLALFPELRARLMNSRYTQRITLEEARSPGAEPIRPWDDGRYGLSPRQFCDLLGVGQVPAGEPAMLLLPRLSEEPGTSGLVRLDPAATTLRLQTALLGAGTWKKTSDLFQAGGPAAAPSQAALLALCGRLAERVECYECAIRTGAADGDRLASNVLDSL